MKNKTKTLLSHKKENVSNDKIFVWKLYNKTETLLLQTKLKTQTVMLKKAFNFL